MPKPTKEQKEIETIVFPSRIKLPYTWHVGKVGSRFYQEIKENCKIWGTKCPQCNNVFVPPRDTCHICYTDIREWVELSNEGTVLTFTVVRYEIPDIQPQKPPFILGIIKLDGATSGFTHLVGEITPENMRIGIRVKAVFKEQRNGDYLDIKYFKPV
jgi:uncharacterized OB-fold protein